MFEQAIATIKPLDAAAMERCQLRLDNLTKPLGSLHSFEYLARQIAGITGYARPRNLRKSIIVMAGDHGLPAENRSTHSRKFTGQEIADFRRRSIAIRVFAEHVSAKLVLADVGMAADLPACLQMHNEKIAYGTKNITEEAAMTRTQTMKAIEVGMKIARAEIERGTRILGLGEIGSGNILPSTAIIACYSSKPSGGWAEWNAYLPEAERSRQIQMLETALAVNCPDPNDPLDVLGKVGGLEIAGLVGVILAAAAGRTAVVLDGLATSAAALVAVKLAPAVQYYLIGSHFSVEPAHKVALERLNLPAYLDLDMNFGEGTGAALGISLVDASLHVLNDMKTFGTAQVAVAQDGPGALKQNKNVKD